MDWSCLDSATSIGRQPAHNSAHPADFLFQRNGLRANSARVTVGEEDGKVRVEKQAIEVHRFSTRYTVCGSVFAMVTLLFITVSASVRFANQEPAISEVSMESLDVQAAMPDVAITINVDGLNHSEAEALSHIHPEFWARNLANGFTDKVNTKELMEEGQVRQRLRAAGHQIQLRWGQLQRGERPLPVARILHPRLQQTAPWSLW